MTEPARPRVLLSDALREPAEAVAAVGLAAVRYAAKNLSPQTFAAAVGLAAVQYAAKNLSPHASAAARSCRRPWPPPCP
jgi:hypothetical protein